MPTFIYRFSELILKRLRNELTAAEAQELELLINKNEDNRQLFNKMTDEDYLREQLIRMHGFSQSRSRGWGVIKKSGIIKTPKRRLRDD